jgi:hypothetical protein
MIYIKDDINYVCKHEPTKQAVKSRNEWGWYDNEKEINGVLERTDLYDIVSSHITNYTNSTEHYCLRSWWVALNQTDFVPNHSHRYYNSNRIISGIFYIDGDNEPLHILENGTERQIDNRKNRLILFDGHHIHWTEPYTGTKTRYSISFDFRILNQSLCDCDKSATCNKCIHMKFIDKGFTAYTGPSKTAGKSGTMNKNKHIEIYHGNKKLNEGDMHDYNE